MHVDTDYSIYGLLYLDAKHGKHANLKSRNTDPIDVYIKCAALCAASIAAQGYKFHLITNDAGSLQRHAESLGIHKLDILQHAFTKAVPNGIAFYAAHFKLDLIESFGTGAYGSHIGLVDIDTVLCKPLTLPSLPPGGLAAYDISDQIFPEYGIDRVKSDLEHVSGEPLGDIRWYGGEFLFGDSAAFHEISSIIAQCWPRYIAAIPALHHVGDEMIVSAALNIATKRGLHVCDAGASGAVIRWWSARTRFCQRPFSHIHGHSLIHLPSDKPFLSQFCDQPFQEDAFIAAYRRCVRRKLIVRHIYNLTMRLSGQPKKYVGRMAD